MLRRKLRSPLGRRRGWCHPRRVRRLVERLFSQQLWCWGRDILHPDGNLLLEYGFARHRLSDGSRRGSTCYRLDDDARHIALWGFGVFFGERRLGGLYVNRHTFQPRWARIESVALGIHDPADLPPLERPRSTANWSRAHVLCRRWMSWIAEYETWVLRTAGQDYRRRCIAEWLDPTVEGAAMPAAWRLLRGRGWERDAKAWELAWLNLSELRETS